jgi:hypothetical protein
MFFEAIRSTRFGQIFKSKNMKQLFTVFVLLLSILTYAQNDTETGSLQSMVNLINASLDATSDSLDKIDVNLTKAEITLETAYDRTGGGGFKIWFKGSKKWNKQRSSSITYTYKKPVNNKIFQPESFRKTEAHLIQAIFVAAGQWAQTKASVNGLEMSSFTVEIAFTVKNINSAGVEFEIVGIGFDGGVDWEKSAVHKVKLTFE